MPTRSRTPWFLLCWLVYTCSADGARGRATFVANPMRSVSFFASTTVSIIAGLIAVFGIRVEAMAVLAELPFVVEMSPLL